MIASVDKDDVLTRQMVRCKAAPGSIGVAAFGCALRQPLHVGPVAAGRRRRRRWVAGMCRVTAVVDHGDHKRARRILSALVLFRARVEVRAGSIRHDRSASDAVEHTQYRGSSAPTERGKLELRSPLSLRAQRLPLECGTKLLSGVACIWRTVVIRTIACVALGLSPTVGAPGRPVDSAIASPGLLASDALHGNETGHRGAIKAVRVGQVSMEEVTVVLRLDAGAGISRAAIDAIQSKVLRDLGKREHKLIYRYENVASMALFVGPEALAFLRSHPDVTTVTARREVPPAQKK